MRNKITAALAAVVVLFGMVAAGVGGASTASAAETVRDVRAKIMVGPTCDWAKGITRVRAQVDNSRSNVWTQIQTIRKNDAVRSGIAYKNLGPDHRMPVFLNIRHGEKATLIIKAPQLPVGKRVLLNRTFSALPDCKLDIHNPRGSINDSTGLATFDNSAGDFAEVYRVEWTNGGNGYYSATVPAGTTATFDTPVHGKTDIVLYVRNTNGSWRSLDTASVTK